MGRFVIIERGERTPKGHYITTIGEHVIHNEEDLKQ
jgi:hypothetical protein